MSNEHRRQLTVNIALLEREQDSLEAAFAKARKDIEHAERTGTAADLSRANSIAESARIALARCEAQLRRLKVELAAFAAGEG
jgi:multidrug resistance efflux pump